MLKVDFYTFILKHLKTYLLTFLMLCAIIQSIGGFMEKMKQVKIKDSLHKKLKSAAALRGLSIQGFLEQSVRGLLGEELCRNCKKPIDNRGHGDCIGGVGKMF